MKKIFFANFLLLSTIGSQTFASSRIELDASIEQSSRKISEIVYKGSAQSIVCDDDITIKPIDGAVIRFTLLKRDNAVEPLLEVESTEAIQGMDGKQTTLTGKDVCSKVTLLK